MADRDLAGIRACVFDAYGTLFDFAAAAAGCADVLGDQATRLTALWRDKQRLPGAPDREIRSLAELPGLVGA